MRKKILSSLAAMLLLVVAVSVYSQNQLTELFDVVFRPQNPQMRVVGTLSVRDSAGTAAGALAYARNAIVTTAATRTIAINECGSVIVGNATSGTQVFTLPAVANTGCMLTFIAGDAGGEILVNMAAAGTCVVTSFAAVGADADTGIVTDASCNTGLKNTAATNAIGDSLTIVSDGTRWLGVGITSGIWASQ